MATVVVVDDAAIAALFGPAGPVAEYTFTVASRVMDRVLFLAPVGAPSRTPEGHPSGWLKSQIKFEFAGDLGYKISTDAVLSKASGRPGDPYGRWIERPQERPWKPPPFARADRPYLVPALEQIFADLDRGIEN